MELSPIVLIIWVELTLLMAGGLVFLLISQVMNKSKGKKSVTELMAKIRADREARKMEIRKGLAAYGLKDDVLDARVSEIDKRELKLYHRIATMYQERSDAMLASMNVAFEATIKPYYELDMQLKVADAESAGTAEGDAGVDRSELEALQKQNEELQSELAVTMDTIGRMLSEYSSMFGSENDAGLDKNKIMEAFDVDQSDEESDSDEAEGMQDDVSPVEDGDDLEVISDLNGEDGDDLEIVSDLESEPEDDALPEMSDDELDIDALFESAEQKADQPEAAEEDIDDILADAVVPADELLEIGDDPILTTSLDDREGDILSDLVDLEADFGEQTRKPADDEDKLFESDDIDDLDIDALLEQNKD